MYCLPRCFVRRFPLLIVFGLGFVSSAQAILLLDGFGGPRGYGDEFLARNDDGSSNLLSLPFGVNLFGSMYSNFFVNNNGNISFNSEVGSYTPEPFPISDQPMIAPYWADVDTRNDPGDDSNLVYIHSPNPDTVVVTWDKVGYFLENNDKLNDFQLVLRNRADTGAGNFDVDFRYNQLQWTTGDASDGTGGLGGTPAQAGYDAGDNVNYYALPGSFTGDVLNLQNTSNVSPTTPGLWTFAIRNGQLPGSDPSNPLMPVETPEGWNFEFNVQLGQIWIDPLVAIGYDYIVNSGPLFASVELPNIGDNLFDLWLWNGTDWIFETVLSAGTEYLFGGIGIDRFRILGIESTVGLDPADPTAFNTGLTFVGPGIVNMDMNPITLSVPGAVVPEPATLAFLCLGLAGLGAARRTASRN
ncbi:MAG: PEP-CTERM sorting domain-containing protein [Gammaproteobacteria bacterium]|nr:PEP-CTERM sorting domain-containing protein [Gammaproteobacteria bacterium]